MRDTLHDYTDILERERPVSKKHPPMKRLARAAQFAPFAALTGHKEAVQETCRLVDHKIQLDENRIADLDMQLQQIYQRIQAHPLVQVTYFEADQRKEGGTYRTITKAVKEIDEVYHKLIFMDKTSIFIENIYEIAQMDEEQSIIQKPMY